jgi:acyl dehydratase
VNAPADRHAGVPAGLTLPTTTYPITRQDLRRYAEASGDHNPIHLDAAAAVRVGLPDVIAHGMLVMALSLRMVEDWAGAPDSIAECGARWIKPVIVPERGTDLVVEAVVLERLAAPLLRLRVTARCGPDKVMAMSRVLVELR